MQEEAIQWNDVHYSVRSGFWLKKRSILRNLNFTLLRGKVLGLIGPNGAGKTTSIKLGAGLIAPDQGDVSIFGRPATETAVRKHLGLLTESQYVYPFLKLREWLDLMGGLSGLNSVERRLRIQKLADMLEIEPLLDRMMHTLSKGQNQRAGLAQALLHKPDILLLDEPMSGLDPYWRYRFLCIFMDYKDKGGSILFSSHILNDVEHLSDHIVFLNNGAVYWSGHLIDLPRQVKEYEIICRPKYPDDLYPWALEGQLWREPSGAYRFSISKSHKKQFLQKAVQKEIELYSLKPKTEKLEEVFFFKK